jgi:alpha-beta hydrolase superfamily lysophospholipase
MAIPTSAEPTEGQRINARGQKLFTVTYRASGQQQAVLFHHHGYGEHVGRMRHCELSHISNIQLS